MTTHLLGQAQTVADSCVTQADGDLPESPNAQRIRESAFRAGGRAIHNTRQLEGVLLEALIGRHGPMATSDIAHLSDTHVDRAMMVALSAFDALSFNEIEALARKAGL